MPERSAMKELTAEQFDGLSIEEREAYLERRDAVQRRLAIGGALGGHRDYWLAEGQRLISADPCRIFNLRALARAVAEASRAAGHINPRLRAPYSEKTIYSHLTECREKLLEPLTGKKPVLDTEARF